VPSACDWNRHVATEIQLTLLVCVLQVLYQPNSVAGCCKTVGEAGEQLLSYLSPLGRTTCHQSIAGE